MKREQSEKEDQVKEARSTRREILRGGLLIAGAAAAAKVVGGAKPAHAADGQPLILGQPNDATSPTTLRTPIGTSGLVVRYQDGADPNDLGEVFLHSALRGDALDSVGVVGNSLGQIGVLGQAATPVITDPNMPITAGVYGGSVEGIGVGGRSIQSIAVLGQAGIFSGVDPNNEPLLAAVVGLGGLALDPNDPRNVYGIYGSATDPNSPGVFASNVATQGLALSVQGRALFSSAGTGSIPAGTNFTKVAHEAVTSSSIVLVTLSSDPIGGRRLKHVVVSDGSFDVVLSSKSKIAVEFGYLIVN